MSNLENVTYCGLYCRLCSNKSRLPQLASSLKDLMADDGWEYYGEFLMQDFKPFWSVLGKLSDFESTCPDCREGCGDPDCDIRKCAQAREEELCPLCGDFPCEHIRNLASRYPNLIGDGERMIRVGVETWIKEQEERRRKGFCYCDIRSPVAIEPEN
jgi:hypothetical protein